MTTANAATITYSGILYHVRRINDAKRKITVFASCETINAGGEWARVSDVDHGLPLRAALDEAKSGMARERAKSNRRAVAAAYASVGMRRVRGGLGGTYLE